VTGCDALICGTLLWQVRQYSGLPVSVGIKTTGLGCRELTHHAARMAIKRMAEPTAIQRFMF
jgi:hypothetical protein